MSGGWDSARKLCDAVESGDAQYVETLLKKGADPNLILPDGVAAVHLAAGKETEGGIRCLKLILHYGGDPNARSAEELTPLHVAASWGCYKCLMLLVRNGGDPGLRDQDGNQAVDLAKEQQNWKCVQILQKFHRYSLTKEEEDIPKFDYSAYRKLSAEQEFFPDVMKNSMEVTGISRLSEESDDMEPLSSTQQPLRSSTIGKGGFICSLDSSAVSNSHSQISCIPAQANRKHSTYGEATSVWSSRPGSLQSQDGNRVTHFEAHDKEISSRYSDGIFFNDSLMSSTRISACGTDNIQTSKRLQTVTEDSAMDPFIHPSDTLGGSLHPLPSAHLDSTGRKKSLNLESTYPESSIYSESCGHSRKSLLSSTKSSVPQRKSVSFCEVTEILPSSTHADIEEHFSELSNASDIIDVNNTTLDFSKYNGFFDSELLVKVKSNEGLDVTSPDHVYLFGRGSLTVSCDLEKTLVGLLLPDHEEEEEEDKGWEEHNAKTSQKIDNVNQEFLPLDSQRMNKSSSSSQYSSCESECYLSVVESSKDFRSHGTDDKGNINRETVYISPQIQDQKSAPKSNTSSNEAIYSTVKSVQLPPSDPRLEIVQQKCQDSLNKCKTLSNQVQESEKMQSIDHCLNSGHRGYTAANPVNILEDTSCVKHDGFQKHLENKDSKPISNFLGAHTSFETLPVECSKPGGMGGDAELSVMLKKRMLSSKKLRSPTTAKLAQETLPLQHVSYPCAGDNSDITVKLKEMMLLTKKPLSTEYALATDPLSSDTATHSSNALLHEKLIDSNYPGSGDQHSQGTLPIARFLNKKENDQCLKDKAKMLNDPLALSNEGSETLPVELFGCIDTDIKNKEGTALNAKLQKMMLLTKKQQSPLPSTFELPSFITPRTKSRLTRSASQNSNTSLFDETIETPTRRRRIRKWGECNSPTRLSTSQENNNSLDGQVFKEVDQTVLLSHASVDKENEMLADRDDAEIMDKNKGLSYSNSSNLQNTGPANPDFVEDSRVVKRKDNKCRGDLTSLFTNDQSSFSTEEVKPDQQGHHVGMHGLQVASDVNDASADHTWLTEDGDEESTESCPDSQNVKQSAHGSCLDNEHNSQSDHFSSKTNPKSGFHAPRYSFSRLSTGKCVSKVPAFNTSTTKLDMIQDAPDFNITLSPGGRPINASINETVEYLYTDIEEGHTLIERHIPCSEDASESFSTADSEDTIIYDWRTYKSELVRHTRKEKQILEVKPPKISLQLAHLSDADILEKLKEHGEKPGPITDLTRKVYLQLLDKLMKDSKSRKKLQSVDYSPELSSALETFTLPDCKDDEMALSQQFDKPDKNRRWREGVLKSSFNYLLLDPRVTRNLPARCYYLSPAECFRTFVSAIFYVGKGKRSRPYSHLYEALTHYKCAKKQVGSKIQHILDIWNCGLGVISLHCFQNSIPVEAYTREACMVDAIGLKMLTNQKKGDYYGIVATWPMKRRRHLGVHILHRAMQIFLAEGERQLRPPDIRIGQ
nr:PREDICTED: ankyrin repeat and LEM domain-containing protein 1 [Latimeria chalumnae]|eukprot:XP_014347288.1 PREDICTED: ankyrin repeat and LEM domain-containing protein 1 [Latimeria chalumnae]